MAKIQNQSTKNDPILKDLPKACSDELAAVEFFEKQRWDGRPACVRCGSEEVKVSKNREGERIAPWLWTCNDCRKSGGKWQFSVRIGTVLEESRIPFRHWAFAFWRATGSKKGVSALEIKRFTGLTYKASLFMLARIRFAMAEDGPADLGPNGGDVQVDETYVGGKPRHFNRSRRTRKSVKVPVLAAVERHGRVRVRPVARVTAKNIQSFLTDNIHESARLITDESTVYGGFAWTFERGHKTVNHSKYEYARGDITTNSVESFFSRLKRGLNGVHHAVSPEHLNRYVDHFAFLHNHRELSDGERAVAAIRAAEGKRLTYRQSVEK